MGYRVNFAGCQQIAFTAAGSTASSAIIGAKSVVLYATKDVYVNGASASPTATQTGAANVFIPASTFFELDMLDPTFKLAAYGSAESGTLFINPLITMV
jgi:hypothetical protein